MYSERLIGHVSRDSMAIDGRERVSRKAEETGKKVTSSLKRGRPKKGEIRPEKEPTNCIEKQLGMNLLEMHAELPKGAVIGGKKNSQGHSEHRIGYKLHLDVDDCGTPISALVTSASMHDTGAAIPLETATNLKVKSLYSLMHAAYNSDHIKTYITNAGKVAIIDPKKPKGGEKVPLAPPEKERYKIRTTVERTNSTIKDDFGGRYVRVRVHQIVTSHLMFGVLAMTALRIDNNFL
jgi:hypothetical protein